MSRFKHTRYNTIAIRPYYREIYQLISSIWCDIFRLQKTLHARLVAAGLMLVTIMISADSVALGFSTQIKSDSANLSQDFSSFSTYQAMSRGRHRQVIFIDSAVKEIESLLASFDPSAEVHLLRQDFDGVKQIVSILANLSHTGEKFDAIHVISHGERAALQLGNVTLTTQLMQSTYTDELAAIGRSLSAQGDMLVYGCNFGEGIAGRQAVEVLAQATGADIASSNDVTGSARLNGNWQLEVISGNVEAETIGVLGYSAVLDLSIRDVSTLANPAMDLANAILGEGITVNSASYRGGDLQSGIFETGSGVQFGSDVLKFDRGAIFSTGTALSIGGPNSGSVAIDAPGLDGDLDFDTAADANTEDASWIEVDFTPQIFPGASVGDVGRITMEIVFGSEEYNESVYSGFRDTLAIIVNGENKATSPNGLGFSIDTINDAATYPPINGEVTNDPNPEHTSANFESANPSFYNNNSEGDFDTQMNGFTISIPVTFDIVLGVQNTLKVGIADAGDSRNDSWLLIKENSAQTIIVAEQDSVTTPANIPVNIDVLANDFDVNSSLLTITHINDQAISSGQTLSFENPTINVTRESDETLTVSGDGTSVATGSFVYKIKNAAMGSAVAFVTTTFSEPDLTPPEPTISVNDITADNILNLSESADSIDVTGTVGGEFNTGDSVTLSINSASFTGTVNAMGDYSIAIPGADLGANSNLVASIVTIDAAGNPGSAVIAHNHLIDTVPPGPVIVVNNITMDNVINVPESESGIDVTGIITEDFSEGDTVTFVINNSVYSSTIDASGNFTVNVPGADLVADTRIDASITTTDIAGNTGNGITDHQHTFDFSVPAVPTVVSQTTEDITPIITGSAVLAVADTLSVTVAGATYLLTPDANSNWSIDTETATPDMGSFAPAVGAIDNDVTAVITNAIGNTSLDTTRGELIIDTLQASDDVGTVNGKDGGQAVVNVLTNDSLQGVNVSLSDVTLELISSTHDNITLDISTGAVYVATDTAEAIYTLEYRICEITIPTNCKTAIAIVSVVNGGVAGSSNDPRDTDEGAIETAVSGSGGSVGIPGSLLLLLILGLKYWRSLQSFSLATVIKTNKTRACRSRKYSPITCSDEKSTKRLPIEHYVMAVSWGIVLALTGWSSNVQASDCRGFSQTQGFTPCYYLGGGILSTHIDPESESNGWSTSDNSDTGYTLFGGVHFKPHWFAELGYSDLGEATLDNSFQAAAGKQKITYTTPSVHLGYWLKNPEEPINFYGKAGFSVLKTQSSSAEISVEQQTKVQLSFGLGAQWQAEHSPLFARIGADFHDKDAIAAGLSVGYQFGALRKKIPEATPVLPAISRPVGDSDGDGYRDNVDKCPFSRRGVKVDRRGCEMLLVNKPSSPVVLEGVNFHTGSAVLTHEAESILRYVAKQLAKWPELKVVIVGHTDNVGSTSYNRALSFKRALRVTNFLIQGGVNKRQILSSLGKGESQPRASNKTATGRAKNRRVELLPQ